MDMQALESQHTSGVYAKREISIVKGEGAILWDDQGREYIDCASGHGVANLGHCHPAIVKAICEQSHTLITCAEAFYNPLRAELGRRLTAVMPKGMERIFLCNSGTEAVEAALKFARLTTGRTGVVAAMRGFHGRTFGALSATYNKKYREPFEPLVPGFQHAAYNNLEKFTTAVTDETAAVILEVIQGEGGVYAGTPEFLKGVQELCREHGALLILDEVQTGFCRTGRMFALEHYGLQPDLLCMAKAIAGGLPMGAVAMGERVAQMMPGAHGSTFGGNPLTCAAALAALDVYEKENLARHAAETGTYFINLLRKIDLPVIREVRGLGLMIGVETRQKVAPYLAALKERGVLAMNAGPTVLRFLPPLVISLSQVERVVTAVQDVLANVHGEE